MCAWVHAASISGASRRRRRQSVAAPPSAPAITPPALTPFLTLFLSLSRFPPPSPPPSLASCRSVSPLFYSSLHRHLAPSRLRQRRLSLFIFSPPTRPKFAKIFEAPSSPPPSAVIFRSERIVENSSVTARAVATVPGTLISLLLPPHGMTRAGHVPYCCWRMDRVTEALFCVNFAIWKFLYEDSEGKRTECS